MTDESPDRVAEVQQAVAEFLRDRGILSDDVEFEVTPMDLLARPLWRAEAPWLKEGFVELPRTEQQKQAASEQIERWREQWSSVLGYDLAPPPPDPDLPPPVFPNRIPRRKEPGSSDYALGRSTQEIFQLDPRQPSQPQEEVVTEPMSDARLAYLREVYEPVGEHTGLSHEEVAELLAEVDRSRADLDAAAKLLVEHLSSEKCWISESGSCIKHGSLAGEPCRMPQTRELLKRIHVIKPHPYSHAAGCVYPGCAIPNHKPRTLDYPVGG